MSEGAIVAAVQGRMDSTRLPQKVMRELEGRPMLWHICHRLRFAGCVDKVVVSTADTPSNEEIVEFCRREHIDCYAGREQDLVDRLYQTAKRFSASALVRVTADCPVVDPGVVDDVVAVLVDGNYDYVSNWSPSRRSYPHGLEVEVYATTCLRRLWEEVTDPLYREWVPLNIHENPDKYRVKVLENYVDLSALRVTVDYEEDFVLMERVFEALYSPGKIFHMTDVVEFLREHPEILRLNAKYTDVKGVEEFYERRQRRT